MNNKFTRLLSLLLALCMLLSFTSCSPKDGKTDSTSKPDASSSAPADTGDVGVEEAPSAPEEITPGTIDGITDLPPADGTVDTLPPVEEVPGDQILDNGGVPGGELIGGENLDGTIGGDENIDGTIGGENTDGTIGGDVPQGDVNIGDIEQGSTAEVVRPVTDGAISVGLKLEYTAEDIEEEDPFEDDENLEGDEDEDWVVEEDIADDFTYEKIIEPYGTLPVDGNKRNININNSTDGIIFTNFSGISTNIYPTQGMLLSQQRTGDREAFVEINGDRFNNIKATFARSWFQIDWMMTNECAEKGLNYNDFAKNWEENPDYQNYYNGIYSFDNEQMQSCIDYWSMMEEAGTEIYLAFGWKVANRIQNWFSSDMRYSRESAPRDLDAYADAAVALYKYVREDVGLTNFSTLAFYNEPGQVYAGSIAYQDFCVSGDKRVWWMNMVKKCREALDKNGLEDVIIASADHSGTVMTNEDRYVTVYLNNTIPELVDMWGLHIYPGRVWMIPNGYDAQYEILCDAMRYMSTLYGANTYVTEYYGSVLHDESSVYRWELHGWDCSNAAFLIAAANNGIRGNFHWGFTGGYLCDPLMFDPANGSTAAWLMPKSGTLDGVQHQFYEIALMNNYIPKDANVHNIEWAGDDIRASAFTSPDGKDFSLIVEAAEESTKKEIEVSLTESLGGKDINVFYYDFDTEYTSNAIIPTLYHTIKNVNSSFSYDKIDGDYGVYIFTTLEPVKQIALFNPDDSSLDAVYNTVAVGGEVSIKPRFIDFDETPSADNVIWEIKRYSCAPAYDNENDEELKSVSLEKITDELGELKVAADGTVTYKTLDNAKSGDIIALRCTLKSDKDVWCSAIVEVKNS